MREPQYYGSSSSLLGCDAMRWECQMMQSILKQLDIMLLVTCRHAHHDPGYYKYTNIEIKEESREIERHTNVDITDEKDALVHVCVCVCIVFDLWV